MEIIIASIIRHLLTLVAGGLLTVGVSEAESHQLAEAATPVAVSYTHLTLPTKRIV